MKGGGETHDDSPTTVSDGDTGCMSSQSVGNVTPGISQPENNNLQSRELLRPVVFLHELSALLGEGSNSVPLELPRMDDLATEPSQAINLRPYRLKMRTCRDDYFVKVFRGQIFKIESPSSSLIFPHYVFDLSIETEVRPQPEMIHVCFKIVFNILGGTERRSP